VHVDIGGGESRLVDALLRRGITCVAVLDVAAAPLEQARTRLGSDASKVRWIEADVTAVVCAEHAARFLAAFGETPLELSAGIPFNRPECDQLVPPRHTCWQFMPHARSGARLGISRFRAETEEM